MKDYEKEYRKIVKQLPEKQRTRDANKTSIKKYSRLNPVEISYSNRLDAIKKTSI